MYQTCCFLNKNGICFVPYSMQSKPQLYKDSSPCMRCSFVKCESGNDLKWKEINENVAEQIMKGCVTGNWINGLADGVSASQVNGKLLSYGLS
ncbi:hypothetical protein FCV25MIE_26656 [Fagus crenata]